MRSTAGSLRLRLRQALTGPSDLFGMTRVVGGEWLFRSAEALRHPENDPAARLKPRPFKASTLRLKRRSFTVALAGRGAPINSKSKATSRATDRACPELAEGSVRPTRGVRASLEMDSRGRLSPHGQPGRFVYRSAEVLRHPKADRRIHRENSLPSRRWRIGGRGPSAAHDVHFVGVILRSG